MAITLVVAMIADVGVMQLASAAEEMVTANPAGAACTALAVMATGE